jgi:hypothetical protein
MTNPARLALSRVVNRAIADGSPIIEERPTLAALKARADNTYNRANFPVFVCNHGNFRPPIPTTPTDSLFFWPCAQHGQRWRLVPAT